MKLSLLSYPKPFPNINHSGAGEPRRYSLPCGERVCQRNAEALESSLRRPAEAQRHSPAPARGVGTLDMLSAWGGSGGGTPAPPWQSYKACPGASGVTRGLEAVAASEVCPRMVPSPHYPRWQRTGRVWNQGSHCQESFEDEEEQFSQCDLSLLNWRMSQLPGVNATPLLHRSPQALSTRFDRHLENQRPWQKGRKKKRLRHEVPNWKSSSPLVCRPSAPGPLLLRGFPACPALSRPRPGVGGFGPGLGSRHPRARAGLSGEAAGPVCSQEAGDAFGQAEVGKESLPKHSLLLLHELYLKVYQPMWISLFLAYPRQRVPDTTWVGAAQTSHCGSVNAPQSALAVILGLSWWTEWCFYEMHKRRPPLAPARRTPGGGRAEHCAFLPRMPALTPVN